MPDRYETTEESTTQGGWQISDRLLTYIIIGCIAVVVVVTAVYVLLQKQDATDISVPPVSQGDVSGADFTVTVTGADGAYTREMIEETDPVAIVTILRQNQEGFAFMLTVGEGMVSGQAAFVDRTTAAFEIDGGVIYFYFGDGMVSISYSGDYAPGAFGEHYIDGTYFLSETSPAASGSDLPAPPPASTDIDANIRKSPEAISALKAVLPADAYAMLTDILDNGADPGWAIAEKKTDKNGAPYVEDSETGGVRYYAFNSSAGGIFAILIVTPDVRFYAGIFDGAEFNYYSNDPAYKSKAPKEITDLASLYGYTIIYN